MDGIVPALRVRLAGSMTSFRHPLFPHGHQPTYPFPPPATLYGLVCAILGQAVAPESFRLAAAFTSEGLVEDFEHIYLVGSAKQGVKLSPFTRQLLAQPRLTLYVDRPDWLGAFRSPYYTVALGRSQDLMTIQSVEVVNLLPVADAFVKDTLLPAPLPPGIRQYTMWHMPRQISAERHTAWHTYAHVRTPQALGQACLADSAEGRWRSYARGVVWLPLM
jgi:CRISPR-associated protein Cas5t